MICQFKSFNSLMSGLAVREIEENEYKKIMKVTRELHQKYSPLSQSSKEDAIAARQVNAIPKSQAPVNGIAKGSDSGNHILKEDEKK